MHDSGHWEGEDVSLEEDAVLENAVQEEYMEQDVNVEDMEAASNNDDEVEVGVVIPENEEKPEAASNMVEVHSTTEEDVEVATIQKEDKLGNVGGPRRSERIKDRYNF